MPETAMSVTGLHRGLDNCMIFVGGRARTSHWSILCAAEHGRQAILCRRLLQVVVQARGPMNVLRFVMIISAGAKELQVADLQLFSLAA